MSALTTKNIHKLVLTTAVVFNCSTSTFAAGSQPLGLIQTKCRAVSDGKRWIIQYGNESQEQCRSLALNCTDQRADTAVYFSDSIVYVEAADDLIVCHIRPNYYPMTIVPNSLKPNGQGDIDWRPLSRNLKKLNPEWQKIFHKKKK